MRNARWNYRRIPVIVTLLALVLGMGLTGLRQSGASVLPGPTPRATSDTPAVAQAPHPTLNTPTGAKASAPASLLQFRSQGHILGFTPERMYTVGMGYALIEKFVGARPVQSQAAGTAPATESTPQTGAPPLQTVTYPHLWDGITLSYTTTPAGLAMSAYRIEPQSDPRRIRLRYNTDVALQPDGSLRAQHPTAKGYFTLSAPKAWQELGGWRVPVQVAFTQPDARVVGFTVGRYDPTYPLLIDPTYSWHTYHGSPYHDEGYAIAVDWISNVYVTGYSGQPGMNDWWRDTALHPDSNNGSGGNIVVLKLTSAGAYQWHTFYGGDWGDRGNAIAVDGSSNVYVTGSSNDSWGAPLHPHSGASDIVALALNSTGVLQWHTFYGEYGNDLGHGIAVDDGGNVYVTGQADVPWGSPVNPGGLRDIVVLKLRNQPDPFTFTDVTGVPLSTLQTSNAVTVSGITASTPISVASGEYELGSNPGVWTASDGMVNNGDTVRVRHTSAAAYSTAVHTILTIGGVADTFTSTTLAAPPNGPDLTGAVGPVAQSCKRNGKCRLEGAVRVWNQGTVPASAFHLRVLLSDDQVPSPEDIVLKEANVRALRPRASYTKTFRQSLPSGVNASGKHVITDIDTTNAVPETDETNNWP